MSELNTREKDRRKEDSLLRIARALETMVAIFDEVKAVQFNQFLIERQTLIVQREILDKLPTPPGQPVKMQLKFDQGELGMPGTEKDTQTIPCTAIETAADGSPVTLNPASVSWAIDNLPDGSAIASVTQNADGSATFKALKVGGPSVVSCTDSSVTPPLVGTNTLEVVASTKTPTAMSLVFGDPQDPTPAPTAA